MNTLSHIVVAYIVLSIIGICDYTRSLYLSMLINIAMDTPAALYMFSEKKLFLGLKRFTHSFFMMLPLVAVAYLIARCFVIAVVVVWLTHIVLDLIFSSDIEYNIILDYPLSRLVISWRLFKSSPRLEAFVTVIMLIAYFASTLLYPH